MKKQHQQIAAIEKLISKDQTKQAAQQLQALLAHGPIHLQDFPIIQLSRIHDLEQRQRQGMISLDDYRMEKTKINLAILSVIKEVEADDIGVTPPGQPSLTTRNVLWGLGTIMVLGLVGWLIWQSVSQRESPTPVEALPFDLTVYLQDQKGISQGFDHVNWQLMLGEYRLTQQPADAQGKLVFEEIPAQYRGDSVRLIPQDARFKVVNQSGLIAQQGKITFTIGTRATQIRGTVYAGNRRVANAKVDIDSGIASAMTDEEGNFSCTVPKAPGTHIQIKILIDGEEKANQSFRNIEGEPIIITLP